jgi:hypothetical protein
LNNTEFPYFQNIGTAGTSSSKLPVQSVPNSKKKESWQRATMEALFNDARTQLQRNLVFADIRKMSQGEFTYKAVDIEHTYSSTPWVQNHFNKLGNKVAVPTHLKHFDFIGIIVNAITGIYGVMPDLYRVDSIDEYFTNEYVRQRTESLDKFAMAIWDREIDNMLIQNGLNPDKQDFKSEEEVQQYQAQLEAQVKKYTPQEVERNMSKNFKVLATEWAQNKLRSDKQLYDLDKEDKKALVDFILTGRWFRHYRVGYDHYSIDHWLPEQVFFSQDIDTEYPQDLDYIGKLTGLAPNKVLIMYGHLMNTKQQELIGNYWGQSLNHENSSKNGYGVFANTYQVPFANYFDHKITQQMESVLGEPFANNVDKDGNFLGKQYTPKFDNDYLGTAAIRNAKELRSDIDVRTDLIEVMDVYWRSMKRIGVLIRRDELGNPTVELTTDDLLPDFIKDEEIKKLKSVSLNELQKAMKSEEGLEEYVDTLSYHYIPEIWHGVMIKASGAMTEDMLLDVKPLEFQIKGDSNLFDVKIPIGGIITNGLIPKILPYQQLHNICMNQNSELLAKEAKLGVFFTMDINMLPEAYKDETTEEAIYSITDTIQNTGVLPLDPSRANMSGSTVYPNIFQRNEVTFANQIQYRQQLAEYYKQQAYNQVGITAQILGQPNTYTTAEGVKQGAQASYALMDSLIQDFNISKKKSNEIHLSIAQFCETNGKSTSKLTRQPDHLLRFLDIIAEDEELFSFRKLSIIPASNAQDRKIVEAIQSIITNDNTITKDFGDIIDVLTNPYALELRQLGLDIRQRNDEKLAQDQQFQAEQVDKQIAAREKEITDTRAHEEKMIHLKGEYDLEEQQINAFGRISLSDNPEASYDRLDRTTQDSIKNNFTQQGLDLKSEENGRRKLLDAEQRKSELEKMKLVREKMALDKYKVDTAKVIAFANKN